MAWTNHAAVKAARANNPIPTLVSSTNGMFGAGLFGSQFTGSTPGASAACDASTTGGLIKLNNLALDSGKTYWLSRSWFCNPSSSATSRRCMLVDRLVHQGGLSGTVTSEQTTNLPTAALTRYTDGAGVHIGLQIYTALGSTSVTVTARYTNQAGTGSRVTPAISLPSSPPAAAFFPLPLQEGDTGVRSVEGVTLSASTLTAGNFGVTLYKPLGILAPEAGPTSTQVSSNSQNVMNEREHLLGGICTSIDPNSCLDLLVQAGSSSAAYPYFIEIVPEQ